VAQRKSYFLLGLFVTAGVLLGVAAVIWLGATKYFQKGSMYVTYFDESVQGLQVDSIVKYRGVDVGTVKRIEVAPDQRLIQVTMKIDVQDFSVNGVVAKLSLAGITGIVYVELDRKKPDEQSLVPSGFTPQYPVIPSSPSGIKQIEAGINDILKSIRQIDFKGISDQIAGTAKSIDGFVSGERMNHIVANLSTASAALASASDKINQLVADGSLKEAIQGAKETVGETRAVIAQVKGEIDGMKMSQTMGKVGQVVGKIDQFMTGTSNRVDSTMAEVQETAERLKRASDSLEMLLDRLNADPSALIFSRPPKGK
jgi:phospholipid/cholesterol/gamma-HCH transport system substrate-binding protein